MPETDFDLRRFQNRVIRENEILKVLKQTDPRRFDDMVGEVSNNTGCFGQLLWPPILRFVGRMERGSARKERETPEFVAYETRAQNVLENENIRAILCPLISAEVKEGQMSSEIELVLIRILTESLTAPSFEREYSINRDPKFFAHLVRYIVEKGPDKYCAADAQ